MVINAVRQQTTSDLSAVVASHHHGSELYVGQVWRSVGTQNCHTSFNVDESSIPRFNQGQRIYKSGIPNRKLWCPTLQFSGGPMRSCSLVIFEVPSSVNAPFSFHHLGSVGSVSRLHTFV